MNVYHTTKDGSKLFISEMENSHLENTIRLMLAKVDEAKRMLYNKSSENKFKSALYSIPEVKDRDLKEFILKYTTMLAPYIMEAMLRGINFTPELQLAYERVGKDTISRGQLLIPESVEEFEEYDHIKAF